MALKKIFLFSFLIFGIFGLIQTKKYFQQKNKVAPFVFINETLDHRFDESIRMSILASKMRSNVQNAVIITDREEFSNNLEQKAAELFKKLHLGENNFGRALLYIYCPQKKLLKIEVGYSLESKVPDIKIKAFELAAKTFIYTDKMQDFWAELINTINIEIAADDKKDLPNTINYDFKKFTFNSGGAGIYSSEYSKSFEQFQNDNLKIAPDSQFKADIDLNTSINNYLESLTLGNGSQQLEILSPESKFFRTHNLQSSYQLFRNAKMYKVAGIKKIIMDKNLAFVFFNNKTPVLPLIFNNINSHWYVNEPLSWGLFQRFESSNIVMLKYPLQGFNNEFENYVKNNFKQTLYQLDQKIQFQELVSLNFRNNFKNNILKLYWPDKTKEDLKNKQLNQYSDDELAFIADAYINLGEVTNFLNTYKEIARRKPAESIIQNNYKFYKENLTFDDRQWILNL
jgi:hypothetical protein